MDRIGVVFIQLLLALTAFSLDKCTQDQLTYEFTECDSAEGRWRVAVPKSPGSCEASEVPVRQSDCTFSCNPGEYVDVTSKTLECKECPVGTYSVGGGVRFTDWSNLPTGFESLVSDEHYMSEKYGYDSEYSYHEASGANCSEIGWLPLGDSISSPGDECTSELSYAVTLQKDGHVSFDYHYTDDLYTVFRVYVRNDNCRVSLLNKQDTYLPSSVNNEWLTSKISLKAGRNVIIWQATAISYGEHDKREPVYIKSIEIQGVSYTSECTPCEPGFYNDERAQGKCKMCQENTFSLPGAKQCLKCNEVMEYAARGSRNCTLRSPCTEQDYYSIRTACDSDHKTQVKYMWIEPKICREDAEGAKQLPASGAKEDCPPCNPGMQINETDSSDCVFCPANHFSDGTKKCNRCPVSTEAVYGYNLQWWHRIPKKMSASCFSMSDRGCASKQGWQPRGYYLDSGINQAEDVYLTLHLEVKGFGNPEGLEDPKPGQYGLVKFVFEMICSGNCKFKFKETRHLKGTNTVSTWNGANTKQKYTYIITSRAKTRFTWTFQKKTVYDAEDRDSTQSYSSDMVKIYSIMINNTLDGGAERCRACAVSSSQHIGCISCPEGNYVDSELHKCVPCAENTYLNTTNPYGSKACIPCGPGLVSDKGSTFCHSNCFFDSKKHGRRFNLTDLNGAHSVASGPSFTSRGFRYYHLFNLSLCGHPYKLARCHSNISLSTGNLDFFNLTSPVCRMTVVPDQDVYTTQTISLGNQLLGIYEDSVDNTTNETSVFTEKGGPVTNISIFFLFKYLSGSPTSACPQGRSVWTIVLCDITAPGKGVLELPAHCPDGTCDGCRFEILFRTKFACPICSVSDYLKVESSCKGENRTTHYMWTEPKLCRGGTSLPPPETSKCSILEQTVGAAMRDFKIGIAVAAALVVLMICCMIGLWYKNRKLTYKYHRLVQNSSDRPGELPGVEKCGVDDDEEDEEEVHFKVGNDRGRKILKKLKDMAGGGGKKEKVTFDDDDDEYFESVHLDSAKQALSDDMR